MGARQKLNSAYWAGNLLLAALLGWLFGSVTVFFVAAVVLLAGSVLAGEIRPASKGRRGARRGPR